MVDGCGCGGEAYGRGGSTWLVAGGEESGVGPMELRLCRRFCWLGKEQKHPPPPNGSFGSEPSLPQGRVCSRLRRSAGRLFVVPTCFKLDRVSGIGYRVSGIGYRVSGIGDGVSGIGDRGSGVPGWGVAGCGFGGEGTVGLFLSGFASSLFRLPSSVFRLGIGHWSLVTGRWSLVVGQWALGSGRWAVGVGLWAVGSGQWALGSGRLTVGSWRIVFAFRCATCRSRRLTFDS